MQYSQIAYIKINKQIIKANQAGYDQAYFSKIAIRKQQLKMHWLVTKSAVDKVS